KPNVNGHFKQIERVISAISSSSKPILCIGGGVFLADAKKEVLELSNKCNIPIVSTMMGFSSVSTSNENFLGMIGMYGNETANLALNQADLVLLIGARVGDRAVMSPLGLCKTAIIIHIDIDPAEIGKNIKTDIPLVGDAKNILKQINSNITSTTKPFWITKTKKQISQTNYCAKTFFNELFLRVDDNATIVTDVGQNQIWAVNEFCVKNGRLLANGGMGAMGYAIPAGIGAIFADKNVQTISICGDGGFQMSMCELATITENHLPLKIVIINNNALGLVKEQQDIEYNKNEIGVIFKNNPSFTEIARACNIKAQQISSCDDFHFIDEMLNSKDAFLLEVIIDKDEKAITTI
ncbi:MAG: thiamine pyrophosphate-binding protein, partial [Oscillospiraceae bacterium]